MKYALVTLLAIGSTLVAGPAHANSPADSSRPAAVSDTAWWPWLLPWPNKPRCPERAPAGSTYVGYVQPPFGLAYDLYKSQGTDGSTIYHQVYCPR
ncbi:hypothetical protein DP939_06360 [Spongiactinospora rosea]|uniref:Uncharacterized protein n=1 Tax=Spongiactinospora rosea TaxID=2248750 RepID=A0A366M5J0_9ACTN|nr:hypothetical protein [Spongiactinospora rosea]RBQ20702.1 hypothetical protein DP939_06360 [Spongiactinospora rosea]